MTNRARTSGSVMASVAAGLCLVGWGSHQVQPMSTETVERTFEMEGLGRIDLIGACTVTADTVTCWDPEGKPNPDLAEKIKAYYIVQPSTEIRMKFGRKNRMIAFSLPSRSFNADVTLNNAKTATGQYLNAAGQLNAYGSNRDPMLTWYQVDTDSNQSTTSVAFDISQSFGRGKLDVKEGSEVSLGPMKVKLVSIKRGPDRKQQWGPNQGSTQKTWTLSIALSGSMDGKLPNLYLLPLDAKGAYIQLADANGKPVPTPQNGSKAPRTAPKTFDTQTTILSGYGTSTQEWSLTVDPAHVGALSIQVNGLKQVTFKNILLDPK